MQPPKGVTLSNVRYLSDYKFLFTFSNNKEWAVDFYPIISYGTSLLKYLDKAKFKKMGVNWENGDIYWGKNWDMCFHIENYYGETEIGPIKRKVGRKSISDKKRLVRLYIRQSVIDAHGGEEATQEKGTKYLNSFAKNKKPVAQNKE